MQLFAPLSNVVPGVDVPNLGLRFPVLIGKESVVPGLNGTGIQVHKCATLATFMLYGDAFIGRYTETYALLVAADGTRVECHLIVRREGQGFYWRSHGARVSLPN